MPYTVLVDDNFHYMDKSCRHELGEFATFDTARLAAQKVVDEFLNSRLQPGMTAEELYLQYVSFGEDPYIVPTSCERRGEAFDFSAWDYAKARCAELCTGR